MQEIIKLFWNNREVSRQTGISLSALERYLDNKVKPQIKTTTKLEKRIKELKYKIDQSLWLCKCWHKGIWNEYEECHHCDICFEDKYYHCEYCNDFTPYKDADSFPNGDTICIHCRASN